MSLPASDARRRSMREAASGLILVGCLAAGVAAAMRYVPPAVPHSQARTPGVIVSSVRAEPRSFNRYVARDLTTTVVTFLMHSALVRINRTTDQLEPELADSWELLPDQRTYRLKLRPGIRFSDGVPFSAEDVVFSFQAIYDKKTASLLADTLEIRGERLKVVAEDATTVTIRFPSTFGPGLRLLDGVPIFPRHRLEERLKAGTFVSAWGQSTPPSEMAGLGPFVLRRYDAGQRLTFDRNPHYWREEGGQRLPRLDQVVLEIVPDQDAESLKLQAGEIDFTQGEMRATDAALLHRLTAAVAVTELGTGLDGDMFWLNLSAAKLPDVRSRWLQHRDFRRAISQAVDRQLFVDTVYLGAAVPGAGIVSPGNAAWYAPGLMPSYDVSGAKGLLASLDLVDRDQDGTLEDVARRPVQFTLLTQKGNTSLERGAYVIRESLAKMGVHVDVVGLDSATLIDYVMSGNYDAAYFRLVTTDTDPTMNGEFWLSSGGAHVWNPSQRQPLTTWESEIDALMERVSTSLDAERRRQWFTEVQRIMARELPAQCFAFPRLSFAMSTRVTNATPAAFRPPVLWNAAVIGVRDVAAQD